MKNTEIHEGFPQKDVRDFLSMQMIKAWEAKCNINKVQLQYSNYADSLDWAKDDAREEIEYQKRRIDIIRTEQSVKVLMQTMGWTEHDVSDDTQNDTGTTNWMCFMGTEDEYEELLHKLFPRKDK